MGLSDMNLTETTARFKSSLPIQVEFVDRTMCEYVCSLDEAIALYHEYTHVDFKVFENDQYRVMVFPIDDMGMIRLSIESKDGSTKHDWRELQDIKNTIVGVDYEAVELYPSEYRKRDIGNVYHLFVLGIEGRRFPFGAQGRRVSNTPPSGYTQRPLPDYDPESETLRLSSSSSGRDEGEGEQGKRTGGGED